MPDDLLLALAALGLVFGSAFLWFRAAMAVKLPRNRAYYVGSWIVGSAIAVVSLLGATSWVSGIVAGMALIFAAVLLLTVAISQQKVSAGAIRPGDSLPDFSSVDDNGVRFESASLIGHPILIKFFRGHW